MGKSISINNAAEKKAHILISGRIGDKYWWEDSDTGMSKEEMRAELEEIKNIKATEIDVDIDSFGGDQNHGKSIYNSLKIHPAKIIVNYVGDSASIATIIGMAGDVRKAPDNWFGLIHEGQSIEVGTQEKMQAKADWLTKVNNKLAKIYSDEGGLPVENIRKIMALNGGEGVWKDAVEMKELGILTETYKPMKAVASIDPKIFTNNRLPELKRSIMANESETLIDKIKGVVNFKSDETLKAENETLKAEVETQKGLVTAKVTEMGTITAELQTEKDGRATDKTENQTSVEGLNTTIENQKTKITSLETELSALKADGGFEKTGSDPNPGGDPGKSTINKSTDYSLQDIRNDSKELFAEMEKTGGNI